MNLSTKDILLFVKIILPSVICILSFILFKIDIGYHVLFFGIVIMLFNLRKAKYNYLISFISSIGISYLAFFISIGLYFGIGYILMQFIELDKLEEFSIYEYNFKNFLMLLPISIFSPILMFLFYKFLFKINKNKYTKTIILITIIALIIFGTIKKDFEDENVSAFWQFVMAIAIQLVLYENEISEFIKSKNTDYNNSYK
ncbi:hypothetical protein [Ichthyenterobacterium magnum]|uniref:Uncharacterized protein n=1 Tax=Ichthyenterobacterium magnum TaxID=1230530 RepID=A0A420DUG1_9FLAO|nr:hypothetical protein [Ichthyenterobacterium magnum]RKE97951.1 hypothetical protein BXY80_0016 [Ichthyenterobacterium magnum]